MINLCWTLRFSWFGWCSLKEHYRFALGTVIHVLLDLFFARSGKLGGLHVSSGILSATFSYWLLLPKEVVLSPFFPLLPLPIACLHSEPAQLLHSQTTPNQRKQDFCWISESNRFVPEGQLQGGSGIAQCRLRNGEDPSAWWCGSSGSAVSELCPKLSFLGVYQDTNSVKPILWRDHTNLFVPLSFVFQCGFFEEYSLLLCKSVERDSQAQEDKSV